MKLIAKIIIAVAIFVAGFYVGQQQALSPSNGKLFPTQQITVDLLINSGSARSFDDIRLNTGSSVFDLLKKVTAENDIEFSFTDYGGDLGVLVESISGVKNNTASNTYWQYWVNSEFAQVGASGYQLKDGDEVEWKYAVSEF